MILPSLVQFSLTTYRGGYEAGKSIVQTPDNGFLLLGWTRSFGNGQRDWYLVKTDSVGNEEWYKTYGDANNQSGWQIITLYDDNYLMAGGGGNDSARVIKVNETGEVIWEKDYSYPGSSGNYIHSVSELPDYSIIATGLTNNSTQSDAGWLLKTDSAGNELWQRRYNKSNGPDLFYALLPTSDGGFLLGGQAGNTATNNNQDAWLLKVDSLGCTFPNCITGIDEAGSKKILVDVYPNPASEVLNIELQEAMQNAELRIENLNGQMVYQSLLDYARSDRYTINVGGFANGIYLLTLENKEQRTTLKIIIQH